MVLPASSAVDAPAHAIEGWIQRVVRQLRLTDRGILLLVDRGQPWRLHALLRRLVEVHPDIEVYTEAATMAKVPIGSTVVLVPDAKDAESINMARALFSRHELRVVLFCERPVSEALRRDAPDFFDWISLVVECAPTRPPHVVAAVEKAASLRAQPIAWNSNAPDAMADVRRFFSDVLQVRTFSEVDLNAPFESLIRSISRAKYAWLLARASDPLHLQRLQWALRQARRYGQVVVVTPERMRVDSYGAGFFPIHAATLSISEARGRLAAAGAKAPGRLAAWLRCEPDAVALAAKLLVAGEDENSLENAVRTLPDPCAYLARLASDKGMTLDDSPTMHLYRDMSSGSMVIYWAHDITSPGVMALHAFELGDDSAGKYFTKRWLRTAARHDDVVLRERLAEWVDVERLDAIRRVLRKKAPALYTVDLDAIDLDTMLPPVDPERLESRIALEQLGAMLKPKDQLLVRRYIEGVPLEEIGRQMGLLPDSVSSRLHRIVDDLRERVAHGGGWRKVSVK